MVRKYLALMAAILMTPYLIIADTEITSLPFTCSTRAERYYLTQDLDWPGTPGEEAISVMVDSVTIDLGGFTITFGSNNVGAIAGIRTGLNADTLTVTNGAIIHNPTDSLRDLCFTYGLDIGGRRKITLSDLHVSVTGQANESSFFASAPYDVETAVPFNAYSGIQCVRGTGNSQEHHIYDCTFENNVTAFWRRDQKNIVALQYGYGIQNPSDTNHPNLLLERCRVYSSFIGLRFGYHASTEAGLAVLADNVFIGRVRNDGPWCTTCSGGYRYGDAFQVDFTLAAGVRMARDSIYYDSSGAYFGGNGIFVNAIGDGTIAGWKNIFDTLYIRSALGPQGGNHNTCIRMRNDNHYVVFNGGTFISESDTVSTDSTRSATGHAFWLGYDLGLGNDTVILNDVTAQTVDRSGGCTMNTIRISMKADSDHWLFNNVDLISDGAFFTAGEYMVAPNDPATVNVTFANCTFTQGDNHNGQVEFSTNENTARIEDIVLLDPTYGAGVTFDFDEGTGADDHEMFERVTVEVTVLDAVGDPVSGADVWVVNSYDTVMNKQTNGSGVATDTITTNYIGNLEADTTLAQYNDFTYGAAYLGDTATATFTVSLALNDTTLTLSAVDAGSDDGARLRKTLMIKKVIPR